MVEYKSAHIDGVESELVVNSGHSAQSNPRKSRKCAGFCWCMPMRPVRKPGSRV